MSCTIHYNAEVVVNVDNVQAGCFVLVGLCGQNKRDSPSHRQILCTPSDLWLPFGICGTQLRPTFEKETYY